VRVQIGARESQVRLQLDPPELGPVRIDVRVVGNNVQLHVQTQTQAAHQLLQARVGELQQALENQGLTVERVQFELREPSATAQSYDREEQTGPFAQDAEPDARSRGHDPTERENAADQSEQPADLLGADAQTEGADETTSATESRVNVWA
jgi:flagellar hook-length control protein FliK